MRPPVPCPAPPPRRLTSVLSARFALALLSAGCADTDINSAGCADTDINQPGLEPTADVVHCAQTSPVAPTPTADVTYVAHTRHGCQDNKQTLCEDEGQDLLAGLLRCEAVSGGWFWAQGDTALRVNGRVDGACEVHFTIGVEGGATLHRCLLPLPMTPWEGLRQQPAGDTFDTPLAGIESLCTQVGHCSQFPDHPEHCATLTPPPPSCGG